MNWNKVVDALPYLVVVMAFVMVRLIGVLTKHQQKMAEILNQTNDDHSEIEDLRREVAALKAQNRAAPVPELEERLKV